MISGHKKEITNDPFCYGLLQRSRELKRRGGTNPFLKLSTKMVDLSLQHYQTNSVFTDIPAHIPMKSQCDPPQANVQNPNANLASTTQEETKDGTTLEQSGLGQAGRELLRTSISWISDYYIRIHASPRWTLSVGIVALALLILIAVYGFRGIHQDSVRHHSQVPPTVQPLGNPVAQTTSIAPVNPHRDGHTVTRSKSKSRPRHDYIAKDTYVYYGKDGKPSH